MTGFSIPTLDGLLAQGVSHCGVPVRLDLNVPFDDDGHITDKRRIVASVPTLDAVAQAGAKVVVAAHLGRSEGPDPKYSLEHVAAPSARNWANMCNRDRLFEEAS